MASRPARSQQCGSVGEVVGLADLTPLSPFTLQVHPGGQESYSSFSRGEEARTASMRTSHAFTPVAIETSEVFGPQSMVFLRDRRLAQVTGEEMSIPLTSSKGSLWQCNVGTLPQYWAPLASKQL